MCLYLSLNERAVVNSRFAAVLLHEFLNEVGVIPLNQNVMVAQRIVQEIVCRLVQSYL